MNLFLLVLSVAIPMSGGFILVNYINKAWQGRYCLFLWGVFPGLGLAVFSLPFFLYYLIGYPPQWLAAYGVVEVAVTAGLGWLCFRKAGVSLLQGWKRGLSFSPVLLLSVILAVSALIAMFQFWNVTLATPYGAWDAWTIWNFRARFIYLGQANGSTIFSPALFWSHLDYPLLLPVSIARLWFFSGSASPFIPALIAFIFTFSTAAVLGGALIDLGLTVQGLLAAFVLVCTPFFIWNGTFQSADVLVSFFLCGIVVLYYVYHLGEGKQGVLLALLGGLLGAAAWTKNDGSGILISFFGLWIIFELLLEKEKIRPFLTKTAYLLAGLLPFGAVLLIFKITFAPSSEYFSSNTLSGVIQKLTDASRYILILRWMVTQIASFGGWKLAVIPTLLVFMWVVGLRQRGKNERKAWSGGIAFLVLILVTYFFVYIISPYPFEYHLSSTFSQQFLQLFPAAVFLFFSAINDPLTGLNMNRKSNA